MEKTIINDYVKEGIRSLKEDYEPKYIGEEYIDETIFEIVDSLLPVMNADILDACYHIEDQYFHQIWGPSEYEASSIIMMLRTNLFDVVREELTIAWEKEILEI